MTEPGPRAHRVTGESPEAATSRLLLRLAASDPRTCTTNVPSPATALHALFTAYQNSSHGLSSSVSSSVPCHAVAADHHHHSQQPQHSSASTQRPAPRSQSTPAMTAATRHSQHGRRPTTRSGSDNDSSSHTPRPHHSGSAGSGPKTGRKGDARMHRAVAARLADSSLSLFEALQIGGFEYSVDDDANSVDQEGVTLGQRKNQLSRRLRQARKHPHPGMEEFLRGPNSTTSNNHHHHHHHTANTQHEQDRKRRVQNSLLEEELEECRKAAKPTLPETEKALFAKNHSDYMQSVLAQSKHTVPNPVGTQQGGSDDYNAHSSAAYHHGVPSQVHVQHASNTNHHTTNNNNNTSSHTNTYAGGGMAASDPPSGVAIATFKSIAQSLGMTMEQLALSLSSSDNILQVLTNDEKEKRKKQQELACNLYSNEIQALIQRCMLLAGYTIERAQEGTPCNLEFSVLAWKQEGERLKAIYNQKYINEPPIQATIDQVLSATRGEIPHHSNQSDGNQNNNNNQRPNHTPHPQHIQVQIDTRVLREQEQRRQQTLNFADGRHCHLLEGKCGHKAILHQPANGSAHIDFVVGNKIECYANVQPIMGNASSHNISVWPSQYNCQGEEVSGTKSTSSQSVTHDQHHDDTSTVNTPRILDLDDVDFTGQEWNAEFANDESLLGLFKLSDGRSIGPSDTHSLMGASTTGSLHGSNA